MTEMNQVESAVREILLAIGEDPDREGLRATPERVRRMYGEIFGGYAMDLETVVHGAVFNETSGGMVVVRDISFYSMCEHHMLPFFGTVDAAYIPDGRVIGLSKIPRIVEMYARRLQIQERMTRQISDALETILAPKGVAIRVRGSHMCSMMRGVKKESATLLTTRYTGVFESDPETRNEFYRQLGMTEDIE